LGELTVNNQHYDVLSPDYANLVRCLSGAFHNLAGALYKHNEYAAAIMFLKDGCELGQSALRLVEEGRKRARDQDKGEEYGKEEGWKQLEEQFYRRYQLLGACYRTLGDRGVSLVLTTQRRLRANVLMYRMLSTPSSMLSRHSHMVLLG
jgi:hypothetical protein